MFYSWKRLSDLKTYFPSCFILLTCWSVWMKLCKKIVEQRTSIIHELGTKNNKLKIKFQMSDFCYQISFFCIPLSRCLFIKKSINLFYFEKRIPNFHESWATFWWLVSRSKALRSHFALAFSIYLKYIPIHIYYNVTYIKLSLFCISLHSDLFLRI